MKDTRIRFLLAGGTAAGINWLVRFPLSAILPFAVAVLIATLIGMIFGFFSYKYFVFGASPKPVWRQVLDFVSVNLVGALVTVLVSVGLRDLPPWPAGWMPAIDALAHAGGIAIAAVVNYLGHRHITFSAVAREERQSPSVK